MAKVHNNATDRMSGKVDQFVYRNCNGKTIAGKKPDRSKVVSSQAQLEAQKKFRRAARYAKSVLNDPLKKEMYADQARTGRKIYNLAFSDYYNAPEIGLIRSEFYTGIVGNKISVEVDDEFRVAAVKIQITTHDGVLVEQGDAVMDAGRWLWEYTCTATNTSASGSVITVTAYDLPGNANVKHQTL